MLGYIRLSKTERLAGGYISTRSWRYFFKYQPDRFIKLILFKHNETTRCTLTLQLPAATAAAVWISEHPTRLEQNGTSIPRIPSKLQPFIVARVGRAQENDKPSIIVIIKMWDVFCPKSVCRETGIVSVSHCCWWVALWWPIAGRTFREEASCKICELCGSVVIIINGGDHTPEVSSVKFHVRLKIEICWGT